MNPRAWLSGASGSPPSAPGSPSIGYPRDSVAGVSPPTNPGAHWFYQISEELRGVVVAAGLTPDNTVLTQLLDAIKILPGKTTAFTPTIKFGGASVGVTYAARSGYYTELGGRVEFWMAMTLSSKGSSTGTARAVLTGLPAAAGINFPLAMNLDLFTGVAGPPKALVVGSTNEVEFRVFTGGNSEATPLTDAAFTNTSVFYVSGTYLKP